MKATKILMDEHRVIERVLTALETGAQRLRAGQAISPDFFLQAAEFLKGFADGCHHRKEEGVLFPAMSAAGVPTEGGPIAVMLAEHEQGRAFIAAMRAGAERQLAGDTQAAPQVANAALGYVALLRQHIAKEDAVLFPLAERAIQGRSRTKLTEDFEQVEQEETGEGVHQRFLALADDLQRQVTT